MKLVQNWSFDNLRGDMFGGITAGIVALRLALAFGVQSGAGAVAGLYGAASCPARNSWLSPRPL